jgi:hypothetical protein
VAKTRRIRSKKWTQLEALASTPSSLALAAHLMTGGGTHRTPSREARRDRRQARSDCRQMEGAK